MTTTSLSIMHKVPAPTLSTPSTMHSSAPSPSDLRASIPIRTSSIRSKTTIVVSPPTTAALSSLTPPRPTSQCSSIHSAFSVSGSLDHRTMTRIPAQSSLKPRPVHTRSSSLDAASVTPTVAAVSKQPLQSTSNSPAPAPTTATTASNERSAFLTSAPVRSRVQIISPRFKNMSPAPANTHNTTLKFSTTTTGSATSLPSNLRCCPLSMGVCCALGTSNSASGRCGVLNLNKRRWSNDSTRGLHGAPLLLLLHPEDEDEYHTKDEDALSGTTLYDTHANDNDRHTSNHKSLAPSKSNYNHNNIKTKNKKRCPTLAWFNFMLRK